MKYKPQGLYFFTTVEMIGLSLEGGGARGSYQAGAAKAFKERGIEFQGITGTSIGSINGAMIAQGEIEELCSIWENISTEKVFPMREVNFSKIADIIKDGGIDISMAQKILDENIDEEKIRARGTDFGIVTFSLTEMKPVEIFLEDIPLGELKNYLLASSALPHFKLDKIHGIKYLDGGVYNALPTDLLINKGYEEIWEIRLNSFGRKKLLDLSGTNVKINIVEPKETLSGYLDFSNETARRQLKLGYFDTIRKLDGLKGNFYYINGEKSEDFFIELLTKVPEDIIKEFIQTLDLDSPPSCRTLFEEIIPRIAELLDLKKSASYEDIVINFLEVQAVDLEMERFKIYSFSDFYDEIMTKSRDFIVKEDRNNKVIEFFLKNEILSKVAKEQSIRHLARIVIKGMGEIYEKRNGLESNIIPGGI